jgi:transposase
MASQYVGIDLHRRRSVIVRQDAAGEVLEEVRIDNDPMALACAIEKAGPDPEVAVEATYGWYWAVDVLQACGARVHLAHPLGVSGWQTRRVKNDRLDAAGLADLLRMNRLPEAWIAPPAVRELRELVRHRAKLVALRSGLKAQVHAVLAKEGVRVPMSDLFGKTGMALLADVPLARAYELRVATLLDLIDAYDYEVEFFRRVIAEELDGHAGYRAIQAIPAVGATFAAIFVAEIGDVTRFSNPAQLCSWAGLVGPHSD